MKVTQNGQTWIYTAHPKCEVCGAELDFVPILLENSLKVCPGCAGLPLKKYFNPNTVPFGECGCREDFRCEEYWQAVETWRTASEFAIRRGKMRDTWRARWWRSQVYLHTIRAQRHEILERIERDLLEEFHHWVVMERPPLSVAMANINHVVGIAEFITQGHVDADRLQKQLEEVITQQTQ